MSRRRPWQSVIELALLHLGRKLSKNSTTLETYVRKAVLGNRRWREATQSINYLDYDEYQKAMETTYDSLMAEWKKIQEELLGSPDQRRYPLCFASDRDYSLSGYEAIYERPWKLFHPSYCLLSSVLISETKFSKLWSRARFAGLCDHLFKVWFS